jgi:hypothetical protein
MDKFLYIFLATFILNISYSQTTVREKKPLDSVKIKAIAEMDSIYKSNIKKTKLYGVYIPKDIDDAFLELNRLSPPEAIEKLKTTDETTMAKRLHFGLGKWISHNWNLTEGSRFSHYLKGLGLETTDDMINFTLVSYHRFLMKKPQELTERAKVYKKKREEEPKKKALEKK